MKSKEIFKATRNEQNLPRNLEQIDQVIKQNSKKEARTLRDRFPVCPETNNGQVGFVPIKPPSRMRAEQRLLKEIKTVIRKFSFLSKQMGGGGRISLDMRLPSGRRRRDSANPGEGLFGSQMSG